MAKPKKPRPGRYMQDVNAHAEFRAGKTPSLHLSIRLTEENCKKLLPQIKRFLEFTENPDATDTVRRRFR